MTLQGIPYVKKPVGQNRWSYDLDMKNAEDCNNASVAKEFKGPCFQTVPGKPSYTGTEDCLYLNIWTPSSPGTPLNRGSVYVYSIVVSFRIVFFLLSFVAG